MQINKHADERNHALVCPGFTQHGIMRVTVRCGTRCGVTIVFHAVLWNGPIRIVVGQIGHKCACSVEPLTFLLVFCSQSLDSVCHFVRWLPYRGTESLSLVHPHTLSFSCMCATVWAISLWHAHIVISCIWIWCSYVTVRWKRNELSIHNNHSSRQS